VIVEWILSRTKDRLETLSNEEYEKKEAVGFSLPNVIRGGFEIGVRPAVQGWGEHGLVSAGSASFSILSAREHRPERCQPIA